MKRSIVLWLAVVLMVPEMAFGQEGDLPPVDATINTVNKELEGTARKLGLDVRLRTEPVLNHFQVRQVYYRMQRAARKLSRFGGRYGIESISLPSRPKGDIPAIYLQDIANLMLEHIQDINARLGISKSSRAGTLPGQGSPELFNSLGRTISLLDQITAQTETRRASTEPSDSGQGGARANKRRR